MSDVKAAAKALGLGVSELEAYLEQQARELSGRKPTVYDYRAIGRDYCQTEGAEHYQQDGIEPTDLIISLGLADGFCLGNVVKYAARYSRNGDAEDLRKAVDYLHILCGVKLGREEGK